MRILVTGASGLIGSRLVARLANDHEIVALTRNVAKAESTLGGKVTFLSSLNGQENVNEFDAIINLAGEPIVNKRWSESQKQRLQHSRWDLTEKLTQLIQASSKPPSVFISGSAIGYYGRQDDQPIGEDYQQIHDEFSHQLCKVWEQKALDAQSDRTRVCVLRTGIVLAKNQGALAKMLLPFKLGLGGPIGDGQHYMSWIHIDDMVSGILFLLEQPDCSGPFNFTAPTPVSNRVFSKELASAVHRPSLLKTPKWALRLAMGEMADLLVYGQNVVPQKLQKAGFKFQYEQLQPALKSLRL